MTEPSTGPSAEGPDLSLQPKATMTLAEVEALAGQALRLAGASDLQSAPTAQSLAAAEAEGFRSVGLGTLPYYCLHLRCGKVKGDAQPKVSQTAPSGLLVDADNGFAHAAFKAAEAELVTLAKSQGLAALGFTRSYSAGILRWFVEPLAAEGLVALCLANAPAAVSAYGATRPLFGTNPLAYALPRTGRDPLVVDQATSAVARFTLAEHAARGEPVPSGWGRDAEGKESHDAAAILNGGSMSPAGGAKGANLALFVEALAVGLTGATWSLEASSFGDDVGPPPGVGCFILALDAGLFGQPGADRFAALSSLLEAEPGLRLPGERRPALRHAAEREGVTLTASEIETLEGLLRS
ncbi:MAG: Ldh family oxidoreductase [Pseudomonadota bacterium]